MTNRFQNLSNLHSCILYFMLYHKVRKFTSIFFFVLLNTISTRKRKKREEKNTNPTIKQSTQVKKKKEDRLYKFT